MGLVFGYQGRPGAAVGALQDAVKAFRDLGDRSSNLAQSLGDLAAALGAVGRGAESGKLTDEALELARALKNDSLVAAILNDQGDAFFYQGDLKSAKSSYEQALRLASHSADKDILLLSKMNLDKIAIADGHARNAVGDLHHLAQQPKPGAGNMFRLRPRF